VQFIVMREGSGTNGENLWAGNTLASTGQGGTKTFAFPTDLPSSVTANRHVLIATQDFAALGLVSPDYTIPNGFLPLTNGTVNFAGVDQMSYGALPTDGVNALNRDGAMIPNLATNFAGQSASVVAAAPPRNYQGLWYNAPAESEAGWGINFAHQGDVIFATWFTYDTTGRAWWLTMTASKIAEGVYRGTLNRTAGPAFNAQPFNPALVTVTAVGEGTLTFTDANTGSFAYTVNGITQTKSLTRQVFGALPTCVFGAQPNLALATNFQDLWYAAPAESEAGWGVNFTHQGDTIFATWFTYDFDNAPLWLSGTAQRSAPGVYTGTLNRTTGPAFSAQPWNKANVGFTQVGTYTLSFANGNSGSFAHSLALGTPPQTVTQTKAITRQVFRTPGTVCQ
jgi:hypothetical protein